MSTNTFPPMLRSGERCSLGSDAIMERLGNVFEEVFDRRVELRPETTAGDVEGWDSVVHVMLILATEREFGIRFESAEIANAANVGEFVLLLEAKTAA
jgi:acyl carrier protein